MQKIVFYGLKTRLTNYNIQTIMKNLKSMNKHTKTSGISGINKGKNVLPNTIENILSEIIEEKNS
jgi:hypothetical protein